MLKIVRAYDGMVKCLAYVAASLILLLTLGIAFDLALRLATQVSLPWVFEYTQHALVMILFLGMPYLVRRKEHIVIDIVLINVNPRNRAILSGLASCIAAIVCYFFFCATFVVGIGDLRDSTLTTGFYPLPRSILMLVASLGFLSTAIEFSRAAFSELAFSRSLCSHP